MKLPLFFEKIELLVSVRSRLILPRITCIYVGRSIVLESWQNWRDSRSPDCPFYLAQQRLRLRELSG